MVWRNITWLDIVSCSNENNSEDLSSFDSLMTFGGKINIVNGME